MSGQLQEGVSDALQYIGLCMNNSVTYPSEMQLEQGRYILVLDFPIGTQLLFKPKCKIQSGEMKCKRDMDKFGPAQAVWHYLPFPDTSHFPTLYT